MQHRGLAQTKIENATLSADENRMAQELRSLSSHVRRDWPQQPTATWSRLTYSWTPANMPCLWRQSPP